MMQEYTDEQVGQYKKICRLADVPELIVNNPYFIETASPTEDDIKWAKEAIKKHETGSNEK
jgi:hypothetical protein